MHTMKMSQIRGTAPLILNLDTRSVEKINENIQYMFKGPFGAFVRLSSSQITGISEKTVH